MCIEVGSYLPWFGWCGRCGMHCFDMNTMQGQVWKCGYVHYCLHASGWKCAASGSMRHDSLLRRTRLQDCLEHFSLNSL